MRRFSLFLTLWLTLALALSPGSAYALRALNAGTEESPVWGELRAGLEEGPRHLVAVIGSGPAGIGVSGTLREPDRGLGSEVVLIDAEILPGGGIQHLIFPDKDRSMKRPVRLKRVGPILADPGVHYFGGVPVGPNGAFTVDWLLESGLFSAVVLATGAEGSSKLNIPGETADLQGLIDAKDVVAFYQGRPSARLKSLHVGTQVIVIGNGNATLDVTNYLIHAADYLAVNLFFEKLSSDQRVDLLRRLTDPKLQRNLWLEREGIGRAVRVDELRRVLQSEATAEEVRLLEEAWQEVPKETPLIYWVTRRGPGQKAFEPREIEVLAPYIDLENLKSELVRIEPVLGWSSDDRERHLLELLFQHPETKRTDPRAAALFRELQFGSQLGKAKIRMRFLLSPSSIEGGTVDGVRFEENRLEGANAVGTGTFVDRYALGIDQPVTALIRSIRNSVNPDLGLPVLTEGRFAGRLAGVSPLEGKGPLTSEHFQVKDPATGQPIPGLYGVGWTGPSGPSKGKVGLARADGKEGTEKAILPDLQKMSGKAIGPDEVQRRLGQLEALLAEQGIPVISAGLAAAVHAYTVQTGFQPNTQAGLLRIAEELKQGKLRGEVDPAVSSLSRKIFAQKDTVPPEAAELLRQSGITLDERLPVSLEEAREFLGAQALEGNLSGSLIWLSPSIEAWDRPAWNALLEGMNLPGIQFRGMMAPAVKDWSWPEWAALFAMFDQPGLQVILGFDRSDRQLSVYV